MDDFNVPVFPDSCLKDFCEAAAHCGSLPSSKEPVVQNLFTGQCIVGFEVTATLGNQFLNLLPYFLYADPSGCAIEGVGLQPSTCWDRGFESHQGHGCFSLVSVCVVR
jgi:hypothetical protein